MRFPGWKSARPFCETQWLPTGHIFRVFFFLKCCWFWFEKQDRSWAISYWTFLFANCLPILAWTQRVYVCVRTEFLWVAYRSEKPTLVYCSKISHRNFLEQLNFSFLLVTYLAEKKNGLVWILLSTWVIGEGFSLGKNIFHVEDAFLSPVFILFNFICRWKCY